jgi:hypothetical protein
MAAAGLTKAIIMNTATNEGFPVMYNPEEFRLEQGNNFAEVAIPGLETPPVQYVRGKARMLSMDLFFDTYEEGADVRLFTGPLVALLDKLPQTQAPPVLVFSLGEFNFACVLVDVNQRYTMFLSSGTPVRSTLSVRFQEYVQIDVEIEQGFFFGPPTLHHMIQGQTLSSLAAQFFNDPFQWRAIAEANNIDDPLRIPPGTALVIPPAPPPSNPGGPP